MTDKHKLKKSKKSNKKNSTSKSSLFTGTSVSTSDNTSVSNILNYKVEKKLSVPINNSYPFGSLGYNFPTPNYSVQKIVRPDDNKYFHNYKYNYNVQSNKPVMTYDQYMYKLRQKEMTPQEYRYYQQFEKKYFYYNGNYELQDNKPVVLAIQTSLNYPTFSGGSALETNNQPLNAQSAYSGQSGVPNSLYAQTNYVAGIGGSVQIYGNSPAYTGVQAKTLPGQNLTLNASNPNNQANIANANANVYNMAYGYDSE